MITERSNPERFYKRNTILRRSREINTNFGEECHLSFTLFEREEDQCAGDKPRSTHVARTSILQRATPRLYLFYLLRFSLFLSPEAILSRMENIYAWRTTNVRRDRKKKENTHSCARRRGDPIFLTSRRFTLTHLFHGYLASIDNACVQPLLFPYITHDTSVRLRF